MTSEPNPSVLSSTLPLAFVAGGSRGLGLLIARELGRRGHRLAVCARDAEELEAARQLLSAEGLEVRVDVCDVSDADRVTALVEQLERETGPVEVAIVVAGVIQVGPLTSVTRSHFSEAINIMLWGPINVALALLPAMRERGRGRIGIITSIGGVIAVPHLLPYSTAKFGAVGFASGLRSELSGSGITATTVVPGLMRTGSHFRAKFVGDQGLEFGWFSLGATLPLIAMDAERAASWIVAGVLAGRAYVLLSPITQIGIRVKGLAPGLTTLAVGLAGRLLPNGPGTSTETIEGYQARQRMNGTAGRLLDGVSTLGRRAAQRFNQQQR